MGFAAVAAFVGSTILSLIGGATKAYGISRDAELQEQAAEESARAEEVATAFNVREFEKSASSVIARGRALRGASGIAFTGSPLDVDTATVRQAAVGAENLYFFFSGLN